MGSSALVVLFYVGGWAKRGILGVSDRGGRLRQEYLPSDGWWDRRVLGRHGSSLVDSQRVAARLDVLGGPRRGRTGWRLRVRADDSAERNEYGGRRVLVGLFIGPGGVAAEGDKEDRGEGRVQSAVEKLAQTRQRRC